MHLISNHECDREERLYDQSATIASDCAVPSIPIPEEPGQRLQPYGEPATISLPAARPSKPSVLRIDPLIAPNLGFQGELTPTSSHGSVAASPVSLYSGNRLPFTRPPRKVSGLPIRRPPSPELLSQDCAFPPFPTNKQKTNASQKRGTRGRSRTSDCTNSFGQEAKRSTSLGAPLSKVRRETADSWTSSTASSSRRPSVNSSAGSRKGSVEEVPPLPPLPTTSIRTISMSNLDSKDSIQVGAHPRTVESVVSYQISSVNATAPSGRSPQQNFKQTETRTTLSQDLMMQQCRQNQQQGTTPSISTLEPLYKAKRPPPLAVNVPASAVSAPPPMLDQSSGTPSTPSTPGTSFARALTSLFGRRQGQPTKSQRSTSNPLATDGPRLMALSPDPDPQDVPRLSNSARTTFDTKTITTPPAQDTQNISQASTEIRGETEPVPEPSKIPVPMLEASLQGQPQDDQHATSQLEKDVDINSVAVGAAVQLSTKDEVVDDLRRVSIDSASSYGSIGFSNSRSSIRSTNASYLHSQMSSISTARTTASSTGDSPLLHFVRFKASDIVPDSSAKSCVQRGQLTSGTETSHSNAESVLSINSSSTPATPDSAHQAFPFPEQHQQRRPSTPGAYRGMCRGCSKPILSGQKSMSSKDGRLSGRYHKDCFVCKACHTPFATADFYVHHDHPYCSYHYHVLNGTLCEDCGKGIEGDYLETSDLSGNGAKKFHPYCLRCATCKAQLNGDYFEQSGHVYCERDAFRIVEVPKSLYDTAPSRPSPLNRECIMSGESGQGLGAERFPERRLTRLMTTY